MNYLYESFESLPEDKKKRIVDASIDEFAQNGYEKASTNNIVKAAGISKGILFHYFGSKKNLYLYIIDYIMEYMVEKFYRINDNPSPDVFERLLQRSMLKLKIAYEEPLMYEALYGAFVNTPKELKEDMHKRYEKIYIQNVPRFYKGIDMSKFRKDINPQKAVEIITIFLDGLNNKYIDTYKHLNPRDALIKIEKITEEAWEYLGILKKSLYE